MANHKQFAIIFFTLIMVYGVHAQQQGEILLYGKPSDVTVDFYDEIKTHDPNGAITHLSGSVVPRLLVYRPESPNGIGIIVCPGGGYGRLNVENTRIIAPQVNDSWMGLLKTWLESK